MTQYTDYDKIVFVDVNNDLCEMCKFIEMFDCEALLCYYLCWLWIYIILGRLI